MKIIDFSNPMTYADLVKLSDTALTDAVARKKKMDEFNSGNKNDMI